MKAGVRTILQWAVTAILLTTVSLADAFTGLQFMLAIFYLLPIGFTAWQIGRIPAVAVAVVSWALESYHTGQFSPVFNRHPGEVLLDTITTLAFFVLTAVLLARLREKQDLLLVSLDTDLVTGAASARAFYRYANQELSRVRRYGHPLTLAYLDLDNFKSVNDIHGHATGDRLLRLVAEIIRSNTREVDKVARLGGDEFAILFPETGEEAAHLALSKVREQLLARMQAEGWPVTVSIGAVSCVDCPEVESLLKEADELMYAVKHSSKNALRVRVTHGGKGGAVS